MQKNKSIDTAPRGGLKVAEFTNTVAYYGCQPIQPNPWVSPHGPWVGDSATVELRERINKLESEQAKFSSLLKKIVDLFEKFFNVRIAD